jgi:Ribosomal protein L14E/L6E/L27E
VTSNPAYKYPLKLKEPKDNIYQWESCIYFLLYRSTNFLSVKSGRVVILLSGRFAGKKAVVVKASEDGNKVLDNMFSQANCILRTESSPTPSLLVLKELPSESLRS